MATVLQLSDTHLTAESTAVQGRDPAARLGAVVNAWLATGRKADLVLLSGDVADDASLAGCRAAAEVVSELRTPVFAIPGNHDSRAAIAAVFASSPSVELGEWRIVGVDSIVAGEVAGALDAPALFHRLDSFDDRPTVVAVHHPPWSPSTNRWFRLPNWEEILAGLAQRPHVRAVVSGHLHLPFEEHRAGLALLGAPSTLYGIRHHGDSWQPDDSVVVGGRMDTDLFVA